MPKYFDTRKSSNFPELMAEIPMFSIVQILSQPPTSPNPLLQSNFNPKSEELSCIKKVHNIYNVK